jgi:hypothetical protein
MQEVDWVLQWFDVVQGTEEWHQLKMGVLSASTAELFLVNGKNKDKIGAGLKTHVEEKYTELLKIEHSFESWSTASSQHGIETEPYAREEFENKNWVTVKETGFIKVKEMWIGFSPDFLIPEKKEGGEIKCYDSVNHLRIVRGGIESIPKKVIAQCQWSLMVSDYDAWNAVFFDPRLQKEVQYAQYRIERDEEMIQIMRRKALICSDIIQGVADEYGITK